MLNTFRISRGRSLDNHDLLLGLGSSQSRPTTLVLANHEAFGALRLDDDRLLHVVHPDRVSPYRFDSVLCRLLRLLDYHLHADLGRYDLLFCYARFCRLLGHGRHGYYGLLFVTPLILIYQQEQTFQHSQIELEQGDWRRRLTRPHRHTLIQTHKQVPQLNPILKETSAQFIVS